MGMGMVVVAVEGTDGASRGACLIGEVGLCCVWCLSLVGCLWSLRRGGNAMAWALLRHRPRSSTRCDGEGEIKLEELVISRDCVRRLF